MWPAPDRPTYGIRHQWWCPTRRRDVVEVELPDGSTVLACRFCNAPELPKEPR